MQVKARFELSNACADDGREIHQQIGAVTSVTCGNFRIRQAKQRNQRGRKMRKKTDSAEWLKEYALLGIAVAFLTSISEVPMMEGVFLQSIEGLGASPFPGELWELLQAEKESVAREIIADGPLTHAAASINESEPWDDADEVMQRRHRRTLESRLRELNDAQDRLIDGGYGRCANCGAGINDRRLRADPAASLCIDCQQVAEGEVLRA
jgi:RNA polymerase-binding transcription factor DksA